jgi:SNF2 family DNA or RNA helicase
MSDLSYHLETENKNRKYYLTVALVSASKKELVKDTLLSYAVTVSEKSALEFLIKEMSRISGKVSIDRVQVPPERAFAVLKLLGATGRVFYQGKKVIIDPFTAYDFYFEADRQNSETVIVRGFWKLGKRTGALEECDWIVPANPSWILKDGVIRSIKEEISTPWVRLAMSGPQLLKGQELSDFLSQAQDEVQVNWVSGNASLIVEPLPFLTLSCRHGGFADLWFDYGAYGKVARHDATATPWRNGEAEKNWEKDLLETDFIKKLVEHSHYYCPLDKVTKSLTFLLEIGWTILDAHSRKVLRQKKTEFDAHFSEEKITIRAKVHYDNHRVDLKDLVGAFNREEHFVDLSSQAVALLDRESFSQEWGDFAEQEVTREGIQLRKNRFGLLGQLLEQPNLVIREDLKQKIINMSRCTPSSPTDPSTSFQGTLFSYQKEGLQWLKFLEEGGFGGLLADEMGLGKTVQILAFFSLLSFERPCLIVVPTSLLFNWKREIEKFLPSFIVYSHQGKDRLESKEALEQKQIILTSYALLRWDAEILQNMEYQAVILDEGQAIKNPDSQIARCCFRLQSQIRLVVTGTPIENRLEDLWSIFHFLQPDLLGERRQFQVEVLRSQMGAQYLDRIRKKIKPFLLRRKKEEVALQLPPKLEQTVFVEMTDSQRDSYERWLRNTKQGLLKKVTLDGAASHRMEILEAILRLRQLCAHPWLIEERQGEVESWSAKYDRVLSDLAEVIEEQRKVLVYSQFTTMLRLLQAGIQQRGWSSVYLDGSTTNREETVCRFQEDPQVSIFLISLKAGGVGLNLTAADYVFLYDPWWNDAVERQAIDRAHRLGKKGTVIARRYITALSIEEKILRLKMHKTALSEQLLESEEGIGQVCLDDLLELLT